MGSRGLSLNLTRSHYHHMYHFLSSSKFALLVLHFDPQTKLHGFLLFERVVARTVEFRRHCSAKFAPPPGRVVPRPLPALIDQPEDRSRMIGSAERLDYFFVELFLFSGAPFGPEIIGTSPRSNSFEGTGVGENTGFLHQNHHCTPNILAQ